MRDFNKFRTSYNREAMVATVGIIAVANLLAGCEEEQPFEPVMDPQAKACYVDTIRSIMNDTDTLPEESKSHNIQTLTATNHLNNSYLDTTAGYTLKTQERIDPKDPGHGIIETSFSMWTQDSAQLLQGYSGDQVRLDQAMALNTEYDMSGVINVRLAEGQTPLEALRNNDLAQVEPDDASSITHVADPAAEGELIGDTNQGMEAPGGEAICGLANSIKQRL